MQASPQVNIVVPLYNEEEVFDQLISRLNGVMDRSELSVEVVLILEDFYARYEDGYDVVYAVRKKRKEGFLKRTAYKSFYRFLKKISYIDMPLDSGDFSLVSRRVIDQMNAMPEESRFLRGMRSWIGYKQIGLEYERHERQSGESKYSFKKLLELALNGIFNFSEYPIKALTRLGILTMSVSGIYLLYVLFKRFFMGSVPDGFTAIRTITNNTTTWSGSTGGLRQGLAYWKRR